MKGLKFYFSVLIILFSNLVKAQEIQRQMGAFQDSLIKINASLLLENSDEQRLAKNGLFVKTLVEALKTPNSFTYPFDSLKNVSIVKPSDQAFRIISWYLQLENGTYRYYGAIQMNTGNGPLKLYPLIDQTDNFTDPNAIGSNLKWFGARYYEIIAVTAGGKLPYYVLLGWKGNSPSTTKKVIEILSFEQDKAVFGAPVFDGKELKGKNRVIFEYTKSNAMLLKTEPSAGLIVFDHLTPFDPEMKGKYEYYGSDGNTDGFKIIGGRLKLQENVELKNNPNASDELYADPKKNVKPIRKFK